MYHLKNSNQGLVTNADQSEALVYHKIATSMSGNVTPLWMIPIQQQLAQLQQAQQQLQQGHQLIQQSIQDLENRTLNIFENIEIRSECRRFNRNLNRNDRLRPMPDLNGNMSPIFSK
jgi:type II secretory pathway predicted ATPase ExeA